MKNVIKNVCIGFLIVILLLITENVEALEIDLETTGSLEMNYFYSNVKLNNAIINVYKVATVSKDAVYSYSDNFLQFGENVNGKTTSELVEIAKNLSTYIAEKGILPTYLIQTNDVGVATINNVATGLYLIVPEQKIIGNDKYYSNAALVSVPSYDEKTQTYLYAVKINIKTEVTKLGNSSPSTSPSSTPTTNPTSSLDSTNDPGNNNAGTNGSGNNQSNKNDSENGILSPNTLDDIFIYFATLIMSFGIIIGIILFLTYTYQERKKSKKNNEK